MYSNMNFPAPIAALGFLAAGGGAILAVIGIVIALSAHRRRVARSILVVIACGGVVYLGLLLGFSLASHETVLAHGQEKYFCEIDCHLAYSVSSVKSESAPAGMEYTVSLRTRFDETTISASRPKDAPLSPSPRTVRLIDNEGRHFAPESFSGKGLMTPLIPGDSYETQLVFTVPTDARGLKLLIITTPQWPDHVVIGDENSWLHKKTYFEM
ncbi:MAG: hypothetical protein ABSD20_14705 [Terriglobales bacterium]|jgi:hypothetical protein